MRTAVHANRERAARRFHALSDEMRLRILTLLRDGERCVCELTSALDASQSLLSFHLRTLKDAGLVTDRREGRWVYYAANAATLADVGAFVSALEPRARSLARASSC